MARLIWAIAEHIDIEGLDPLLADDPDDPLNVIISNIHKVLFNVDSTADTTNRVQDVQAVLISAQRLGSRHPRAGQLLTKELEEFRTNALADSVSKHQCRLILQRIKYASGHPDSRCEHYAINVYYCCPYSHGYRSLFHSCVSSVHSFFFLLCDNFIDILVYYHCEILAVMVLVVEKLPAILFLL